MKFTEVEYGETVSDNRNFCNVKLCYRATIERGEDREKVLKVLQQLVRTQIDERLEQTTLTKEFVMEKLREALE